MKNFSRLLQLVSTNFLLYNIGSCQNIWNTLYSYTDGKIYMHMKGNFLVSLNFSVTSFGFSNDITSYNLESNQQVLALSLPPANATLFLNNSTLYGIAAFIGSSNTRDSCGSGIMALYQYENDSDQWILLSLNLDGLLDASMYSMPTILSSLAEPNTVYVFGGQCSTSGAISNNMVSLDMNSLKVYNISTSVKPRAFYGAGIVLAPSLDSMISIGGMSPSGWLSMNQLAVWTFNAGWSSQSVPIADNSLSIVDSRTCPLVLPLFEPINDASLESLKANLKISSALVIGGDNPDDLRIQQSIMRLDMSSSRWSWNSQNVTKGPNSSTILGAATILNTLVVINRQSDSLAKRSNDAFILTLYDVFSFNPVNNLKENWLQYQKSFPTAQRSQKNTRNIALKVCLVTVTPVLVILIMAILAGYYWRKRLVKLVSSAESFGPSEYEMGNYSALVLPYPGAVQYTDFANHSYHKKHHLDHHDNSGSTLDAESMHSWLTKRLVYNLTHILSLSKQTLLHHDSSLSLSTQLGKENDVSDVHLSQKNDHLRGAIDSDIIRGSCDSKSINILNINSHADISTTLNPFATKKVVDQNSPTNPDTPKQQYHALNQGSVLLVNEIMDIQFLVRSKRRLVLKVANPDAPSLNDHSTVRKNSGSDNPSDAETRVRQRAPSDIKK